MPIISVTLPNDGETADAADVDDPIEAILAVVNGNLDQDNIADGGVTNSKLATGSVTPDKLSDSSTTGWSDLSNAIASVANNGNHSFSLTVNTTDLTSKLSPGMRVRMPRASSPNGQSTNLNGSSQYWSVGSPSGITFTDDFSASAWIKITSFPSGDVGILSRADSTQGWWFGLNNSGQLILTGANGSPSNYRRVKSVQAVPLNRWVKVSAELDMFGFTATTCKFQIDDVDYPAYLEPGGSSPTSLVQAGNLQVGAINGSAFFPGKIKQVALFNALISPATMKTYSGQTMIGSEPNCIALFKFDGNGNDSSGSGNNLTAQSSATATEADSPFNASEYGIIQQVSFSTNTTIVVQTPTGYTLPTSGGFGTVSYSALKNPYGFPGQRRLWSLEMALEQDWNAGGSVQGTWYNVGGLFMVLPIGEWSLNHRSTVYGDRGSSGDIWLEACLSTLNNQLSDQELVGTNSIGNAVPANVVGRFDLFGQKEVVASALTNYYWLIRKNDGGGSNLDLLGSGEWQSRVWAVNGWL